MDSFTSAHAFGLSLVDQGHFAAEEIQENCEEMTLVKDELMESWKEKQVELSQSYELQVRLVYARIAYLSYTGKETPCRNALWDCFENEQECIISSFYTCNTRLRVF